MRELSEQELEEQYKEAKMMEVPSMWDKIEGNLADRERIEPVPDREQKAKKDIVSFRKRIPVGKLAAAAAALAVMFLLASVFKPLVGTLQKEDKSMADQNKSDKAEQYDSAYENSSSENDSNYHLKPYAIRITVRVKSVEAETHQITAEVLEAGESSLLPGDEVLISYAGSGYEESNFSGVLKLQVEKRSKNFKLIEILP